VADPSDGRNTDGCPGHFESKTAALDVLNDPNAHCNHLSCNKNRVSIGFDCLGMKSTPSARAFVR
jgi:hypothetical protein